MTTVFTAPILSAAGSMRSRCSMIPCLYGIVTFAPLMPYPRMTSPALSRSGVSNGRYTPLMPFALSAAFCIAGDLLLPRGLPIIPSTVHPSPRSSISPTLNWPGAVGSPMYPNENSFPRMSCLMRVTAPSAPIPSRTCLPPIRFDASRMEARSAMRLTLNAPLRMSASMPESLETIPSASGVTS